MSAGSLSPAMRDFIEFFGEVGPRWGLPKHACRVHAYLYLMARFCSETDIAAALSLDAVELSPAIDFLRDYQIISVAGEKTWRTSDDPWEAMFAGLEARRRRELPAAMAMLRQCRTQATTDGLTPRIAAMQIAKMNELAESLTALDRGIQRLPPRLLRGVLALSGRVGRLAGRS